MVSFNEISEGNYSLIVGQTNSDYGSNNIVGGQSNLNTGSSTILAGIGNTTTGSYSLIAGENHTVNFSFSNLVVGNANIIYSSKNNNIVGGTTNEVLGSNNLIVGSSNFVQAGDSLVGGQSNIPRGSANIVSGFFCETGATTLYSIVTGSTNELNSSNASAIIGSNAVVVTSWTNASFLGMNSPTITVNGGDSTAKTFVGDLIIRNGSSLTAVPSATADTVGYQGQIIYDDSNIYIKTSAGWKIAALSTF